MYVDLCVCAYGAMTANCVYLYISIYIIYDATILISCLTSDTSYLNHNVEYLALNTVELSSYI